MIGSMIRMELQNNTEAELGEAIHQYLFELREIGYTKMQIRKAITKMKHKHEWKHRLRDILAHIDDLYKLRV